MFNQANTITQPKVEHEGPVRSALPNLGVKIARHLTTSFAKDFTDI